MDQNNLNKWICIIAMDMIKSMASKLPKYQDSLNSGASSNIQSLIIKYNNSLVDQHNKIHEVVKQMNAPVTLDDEEDDTPDEEESIVIYPEELKAQTFCILSDYLFFVKKYSESLEYAVKSFALFKNQDAMFSIARCKEKVPVQTKALAGAKKKQEAEEEKKSAVIAAYLEAVKMDPFSTFGRDAAKKLINQYKYQFNPEEVF